MKKILLAASLVFITGTATVNAQVNISLNIGSQPQWGPTGYDYVNYYYMPDIDVYYNVPQQQWIYNSGNRWITSSTLPSQYSKYNLYNMHKVVINEDRPYLRNNVYRTKYASFKGKHDQQWIRDSRDQRYISARNNNGNRGQQNNGRGNNNPGNHGNNNQGNPGNNQGYRGNNNQGAPGNNNPGNQGNNNHGNQGNGNR